MSIAVIGLSELLLFNCYWCQTIVPFSSYYYAQRRKILKAPKNLKIINFFSVTKIKQFSSIFLFFIKLKLILAILFQNKLEFN